MVEMDKEVDRMIPSLEEFENKREEELRQQEKKAIIKQTLIAVFSALVGDILFLQKVWLFQFKAVPLQQQNPPHFSSQDQRTRAGRFF